MRAEEPKRAANSYKTSTSFGTDGFHPKVPLDLSNETCEHLVGFPWKVEQCGCWPVQASTLFLLPQSQERHQKDQLHD